MIGGHVIVNDRMYDLRKFELWVLVIELFGASIMVDDLDNDVVVALNANNQRVGAFHHSTHNNRTGGMVDTSYAPRRFYSVA